MRPRLKLILQLAVTAALVAVLVTRVDLAAVGESLAAVDGPWLTLLALLMIVQALAAALRWWRVLAALGEPVPLAAVAADTFVGTTYNLLLPTTMGGDVVRGLRCARRVSRPASAFSSVLYERVAGLLAVAAAGVAALAAGAAPLPGRAGVAVTAVAAALLALVFLRLAGPFRFLARLLERRMAPPVDGAEDVPGPETAAGGGRPRLAGLLDRVGEDLDGALARPAARGEVIAWSVLAVGLGLAFGAAAAGAVGAPGSAWAVVMGLPAIFLGSMLPITINGLGLREGLFVVVLGALGVAQPVAFAIALLSLAGLLLQGLVGLGVLAVEAGGRRRRERGSAPSEGA